MHGRYASKVLKHSRENSNSLIGKHYGKITQKQPQM